MGTPGTGFDMAIAGKEFLNGAGVKTINRNMTFSNTACSRATAHATVQFGYGLVNGLNFLIMMSMA